MFKQIIRVEQKLFKMLLPPKKAYSVRKELESLSLAYNIFEREKDNPSDNPDPPLLVFHGLFGSKQNWKSISKAINARTMPQRQTITVDARNHGESPHSPNHTYEHLAADIAKLLQHLDIKKAALLGHSMGGRAVMYFALKYPELVERVVIVDISPVRSAKNFMEMQSIFGAMKAINVQPGLSLKDARTLVAAHLSETIKDKATIDFILLNLKRNDLGCFYWAANVDALHNNFLEIAKFPDSADGLQYTGPVLFIAGTKSTFVSPGELPEIQKYFPKADLTWLDTGHLVHLEKPADFLDNVVNFLNSEN